MQHDELHAVLAALRKALHGTPRDEKAVIQIAAAQPYQLRHLISEEYEKAYGNALSEDLKALYSGDVQELMLKMFEERYDVWSDAIYAAVAGLGTDDTNLIALTLFQSDKDTEILRPVYKHRHEVEMEKHVEEDLGHSAWNRLIKGWMREHNTQTQNPEKLAESLKKAAQGLGTDEDVFINVLTTIQPECYRQAAAAYQKNYGVSLEKTIKAEFSGRAEFAFLLGHYYLMNPADAVAYVLYKSMVGLGTNERMMINATALFCDLFKGSTIKEAYGKFGDLAKDFKGDLSGLLEYAILTLWHLDE